AATTSGGGGLVARLVLAVALDLRQLPHDPAPERQDFAQKTQAKLGELVFDARRHFGIERAGDKAFALEHAQGLRQNLLAYRPGAFEHAREAERPPRLAQHLQHGERPFAGNALQELTRGLVLCLGHAGAEGFRFVKIHCYHEVGIALWGTFFQLETGTTICASSRLKGDFPHENLARYRQLAWPWPRHRRSRAGGRR